MVKLLQRLRIWRELKRLESKARDVPSPTTYVDLGQVYINLGMHDQTLRVSEEGLALFPNSKELRKLNHHAKKSFLRKRINTVRRRLSKSPEARLYRELGGMYLELGDYGAVHGACDEGIRRFPEDPGIHLVLARARLANFYRDLRAEDGMRAVRSLETVVAQDPSCADAHQLLAEVLYRIGAVRRSVIHLRELRRIGGEAFEVETLLRKAQQQIVPGAEENLDQLLAEVEMGSRLTHGPITRDLARGPDQLTTIRESLAQISEIPGVTKAAYIRGSKALIKGQIRDGRDPFLRMARVVAKASQRACRRIDLGNFSKGVIDGDFGHVCVCSYGEVVAAVLCDPGTAADRILGDLQDLVAKSLYLTETAPR